MSGFQWQQEYRAAPMVYWTECLGEPTGNYYESREAAQMEVDYFAAKQDRYTHPKVTIRCANIHSLKLSTDRWAGAELAEKGKP